MVFSRSALPYPGVRQSRAHDPQHRAGIDAAINRGLSNGRHEGLNTKVRLLIRRGYGFHSAEAALALVMLACGPVKLELPYHTSRHPHSWQ